jgi:hypothetical protein
MHFPLFFPRAGEVWHSDWFKRTLRSIVPASATSSCTVAFTLQCTQNFIPPAWQLCTQNLLDHRNRKPAAVLFSQRPWFQRKDAIFTVVGWKCHQTYHESLLAEVGFALALNWGQTGCSFHHLSCQTGRTATPPRTQTQLRPSRWVSFVPTSSYAQAHTHIQDEIHRECCECNAM